jgi:predicted XRE-type DNA-binding protein
MSEYINGSTAAEVVVTAAEVVDMLQSGMKQSQIAAKLGVSRQRIGQIMNAVAAGKDLPENEEEKENE